MSHTRLAIFTLFLLPGCYYAFNALEEVDAGSRGDGGTALEAGRPEGGALDASLCEDVCAEGETACRGASLVTCDASREGCLAWGPEQACANPPPAECIEGPSGAILRIYAAAGACADGACTYAASDMPCMFGCAESRCVAGELALDAYLKASNSDAGDGFGHSVSLSADGSVLAVGACAEDSAATGVNGDQNNNSATSSGAVYLFRRSAGGAWAQEAYLKASNSDADDYFGFSVSLSADGSVLAVGAVYEDSAATGINGDQSNNSAESSGAVYLFRRSAGGAWTQEAYLKASNSDANDHFGFSVSLSADGSVLAVGAIGEDSAATGINGDQNNNSATSGAVYLFRRSAGGAWTQEAYLKASNSDALDWFGHSVSLSADGSVLAVGAIWEDSAATGVNGDQNNNSATDSGAVYLFRRSAGGAWTQEAYLKASNSDANDHFGFSVSLSADGSVLAVGAVYEDSAATGINGDQNNNSAESSGAVFLFRRSASGAWTQEAYLKASNSDAHDHFGYSVSLSADGSVLAVGAPYEGSAATGINGDQNNNSAENSGAVFLFRRSASGAWTQEAYLKASNSDALDWFGRSVSLSADGSVLAVGAIGEDSAATGINGDQNNNSATDSGAVYVYR